MHIGGFADKTNNQFLLVYKRCYLVLAMYWICLLPEDSIKGVQEFWQPIVT